MLESLVLQTVAHDRFEVVVVDDGSPTARVRCAPSSPSGCPLRYVTIPNSGIAAAKNAGHPRGARRDRALPRRR